jgi:hypothetical protein
MEPAAVRSDVDEASDGSPARRGRFRHGLLWWGGAPLALLVLLLIGLWQVGYKQELTLGMRYLGHADPCSYATIARSLYQGRGYDVDYITFHFIRYDPGVTHREDHWPVLLPTLMAGMYWIFEDAPWVARLTSFGIASFLLPLATFALGLAYSRRVWVGLAAGALMLGDLAYFNVSMETYSDILTAVCVVGLAAAVVAAVRRPWVHVVAGLMAAACFYAKGSLLLMVGVYPLAALVAGGWSIWRSRWLWAGVAVGMLGVAPWLISSWRLYGNPLHCTQNFVGGYYGLFNYEVGSWTPTFGEGAPELPKISDRWTKYGEQYAHVWRSSARAAITWAVLGYVSADAWLDLGAPGAWIYDRLEPPPPPNAKSPPPPRREAALLPVRQWQNPVASLCGITATLWVAGVIVVGFICGAWRLARRLIRRGAPAAPAPAPAGGMTRATLAIILIVGLQGVFVTFFWRAEPRFLLMFVPAAAAIACTAVSRGIELPATLLAPHLRPGVDRLLAPALAMTILAIGYFAGDVARGYHQLHARTNRYPYTDRQIYFPRQADIIRRALPKDAVLMTRHPWEMSYFTGLRTVVTPYCQPPDLFSICRYYGVTHFYADTTRPGMREYQNGKHPGLVQVEGGPANLFELRYEHLPDSGLATDAKQTPTSRPVAMSR